MKGSIHNDTAMSWNDDTLMDILLGHVPQIRATRKDNEVRSEIGELKNILDSYRYESTNGNTFLEEASHTLEKIKQKDPSWYGISLEEISYFVAMQRFCVINGYGGMGKSYFIFWLEEQLTNDSIPHLCIYGKYQKTIDNIDFLGIQAAAEHGLFLFVVDALNEMECSSQKELVEMLKGLCNCQGLRVIITYRTHNLSPDIMELLGEMASYQYAFTGVSYDSALELFMRKPVLNVYKYESILYTNNAFYLNILCKILEKPPLEEETINSFSTLTYILEQYIKETAGKEHWKNTKIVTQWMYENRSKIISRESLCQIIQRPDDYIGKMKQYGLLVEIEVGESIGYTFAIETLTDFLLARYFVQEIRGLTEEEQLSIIKQRRSEFVYMDEAFIVSLFDLTQDYGLIRQLLTKSGLLDSFDLEMVSHINFKQEDIRSFQEVFHISHTEGLISIIGGYSNKPFNCVNFLNARYIQNKNCQLKELSSALSGTLHISRLMGRLKNMIYFVSIVEETIAEEMLWFALWCTASPNQRIRCYAIKLLFEILKKEPNYIDELMSQWNSFSDYYIQEAIIQVFSLLSHIQGHGIDIFLSRYKDDPNCHSARSLKRIGNAQGSPYQYIILKKDNLYQFCETETIPEALNNLLCHVSLIEETLLPFRYWSKNHIDTINRFIQGPKEEVGAWNNVLASRFSCVKRGDCNGSYAFEQWVKTNCPETFSLQKLDMTSFIVSFGKCIEKVMRQYGVNVFDQTSMDREYFGNSICRKVIDIAVDIYYGSVMCNYYKDQFASFNNIQESIGMEVYDPIEYEEEEMHIASPIPTYASAIEILGDTLISTIFENDICFDEAWSKDEKQSISNLMQLIQPVSYKKTEWVLLNAKIRITGQGRVECYDIHCCTEPETHLTGVYDDRYLTIELPEYYGAVDHYALCEKQPGICKEIPSISGRHDWFDTTELMFPPVQIVRDLGLRYEIASMSWNTENGDKVILCDNNKNSYLQSNICSSIFMRKDYYDSYIADHPIHYFCYTEKMLEGRFFTDEASLHLEINDGKLVHKFYNADEQNQWHNTNTPVCETCPYGFGSTEAVALGESQAEYLKLLKQYGHLGTDDDGME